MQDVFFEESCKSNSRDKKKILFYAYKVVSIIFYIFAFIWAVVMLNFLEIDNLFYTILAIILPAIILIISGVAFGKLKDRIIIDYDYTFVTGNIRFSKVLGEVKRIDVVSFDCNEIEKIGLVSSKDYEHFNKMPDINKHILTQNNEPSLGKDFYYIVVNCKSKKHIVTIECSKEFIQYVIRFSKSYAIEDELTKKLTKGQTR